ncbi:MAG: multiheme c-type cytochrome, partial [Planctomycetota bacterium]
MILGTHRSIAVACMILADGFLSVGLAQSTNVPPINKSDFFVQSGCDGASCHKSAVIATPIWSNAVHIWSDHDPHARAYRSLLTKDSLAIVQKLWNGTENPPSRTCDPNYLSFLEKNCASCHASELAPVSQRQQGVDCQSCHGSATVWDPSHYSSDWRVLGVNRFKDPSDPGRLNMESAWVAARVCGSCHIGELGRVGQVEFDDRTKAAIGQREVSHKLMAAGHPPTYFELSHFL